MWLHHLDTNALKFVVFFVVPDDLLRCRIVVIAKLRNCRVPSSAVCSDLFHVDVREPPDPPRDQDEQLAVPLFQ